MANPNVKFTDVINKFKGDGGSDIVEWLKTLELVARLQKIEDLAAFAPLFLDGNAFAIYDQMEDAAKDDYKKIKAALLRSFSLTPFQAYKSFKGRVLQRRESPETFLSDLRRLASLFGDNNEGLLACQFVSGMPGEVPGQLKALKEGSQDVQQLLDCVKQILQNRGDPGDDPLTGAAGRSVRAEPRGQAGPGGSRPGNQVKCYGCDRFGHIQRECPVICRRCKKRGHIERKCQGSQRYGNPGTGGQGQWVWQGQASQWEGTARAGAHIGQTPAGTGSGNGSGEAPPFAE